MAGPMKMRATLAGGNTDDVKIFHAGTKSGPNGEILANGGRVLNVTAMAPTIKEAQALAYAAVRLGEWQFDRLEDRETRNAVTEQDEHEAAEQVESGDPQWVAQDEADRGVYQAIADAPTDDESGQSHHQEYRLDTQGQADVLPQNGVQGSGLTHQQGNLAQIIVHQGHISSLDRNVRT